MSISESEQYDLLDRLAEEFADRFRRERPTLEEYTDRYPELAEEIRELFPAMVKVEQADDLRQGDHEKATRDSWAANPPRARSATTGSSATIGRGGMGVVYEAEQISLGRRVALKILPRQGSSDRMVLERFRREAAPRQGCTTPTSCRSSRSARTATSAFTPCSSSRVRAWTWSSPSCGSFATGPDPEADQGGLPGPLAPVPRRALRPGCRWPATRRRGRGQRGVAVDFDRSVRARRPGS